MKPETNQIRFIFFDWSHEEGVTKDVWNRLLTLPKEIEIKQDLYCDEIFRRKMAQSVVD